MQPLSNTFNSPFIGRREEMQEIRRLLKSRQNISVVGPPGIGKTTLLRHLTQPGQQPPSPKQTAIWFDGKALSDVSELDFHGLLTKQLQQIGEGPPTASPADPASFRDVSRWARRIQQNGIQLIIVLDHLEHMTGNPYLDANSFSGLRSLATSFGVSYLTASHTSLWKLADATPRVSGSPFFNIFREFTLRPLSQAESRQLVGQLTDQVDVSLSEEVVAFICDLAEGRPGYLQRATQFALDRWPGNNADWQKADYELVEQRFREALEYF